MSFPELTADAASAAAEGQERLVLVVEDNDKNARLTIAMLAAAGYRTCLAGDGVQGLETARDTLPDLIITDLQMPIMDGLSMTRALRNCPATSAIPVLAVSAHALHDHREQALAAGCCGFLTKPFRFRELLAEVAAGVSRGTSTSAACEK